MNTDSRPVTSWHACFRLYRLPQRRRMSCHRFNTRWSLHWLHWGLLIELNRGRAKQMDFGPDPDAS